MTELDESDPMSDDDVFDDAPVKAAAEKVEAPAEEKTEAKAEVKTEAKAEEPTASKQDLVPKAALIDERRKRQALEDENRKLKGGAEIDPATEALNRTILISRDLMLDDERYKDYPEREKVFMSLVSEQGADGELRITDAALYEKFRNSPNPAKFAYNHAKQHQDFLERSSPEYEKKLREKIEAEVFEKLKKSGPDLSKLTNLTNLAASANNTEQPKEVSPADDDGVWD